MIEAIVASVGQAATAQAAAEDVWRQLKEGKHLRANAVGLLACQQACLEDGWVEALAQRLPFPLVGGTVPMAAACGSRGQAALCLTVLTSDDVRFAAGVTKGVMDAPEEAIRGVYKELREQLGGPAVLGLAWHPIRRDIERETPDTVGDVLAEAFTKISGARPLFGTLAMNDTGGRTDSKTILGGQTYADELVMLMLAGEVAPRFFVASFPVERTMPLQAVITQTEGSRIITINDEPAAAYLERLGLMKGGQPEDKRRKAVPVAVNYHDSTKPKTSAFFSAEADGSVLCGSALPVGATMAIGSLGHEDVLETTEDLLQEILQQPNKQLLLLFSCFSRYAVLNEADAEIAAAQRVLEGQGLPYMLAYSGGELCPLYAKNTGIVNRYHNYSIVACLL